MLPLVKRPVPWAHAPPSPWQPAREAYAMELAAGGLGLTSFFPGTHALILIGPYTSFPLSSFSLCPLFSYIYPSAHI